MSEKEKIKDNPIQTGAMDDSSIPPAENKPSKRDMFMSRFKSRHADYGDDDDSVYGGIGEDYDKLGGYEENEKKIVDAINKNPRNAEVIQAMLQGKDIETYMLEKHGDSLRDIIDDPEEMAKYLGNQQSLLAKIAENEKLQSQAEENFNDSLDELDAAAKEMGNEDEAGKAIVTFNAIVDDAVVGKVSKDTWLMILKAMNFDSAVENSRKEGEIKGRNTKIQERKKKRTLPKGVPPTLGGQSASMIQKEKRGNPNLGPALESYRTR